MMQRREFLRRCALIAAGIVAADQLDVLEMLAPRKFFLGAEFGHWEQISSGRVLPDGGYESTLSIVWNPTLQDVYRTTFADGHRVMRSLRLA